MSQQPAPRIDRLHGIVDELVDGLVEIHRDRLVCHRGCSGCCVDGIRVWDIEAERIRQGAADLLAHGSPHPTGACAFLDEQGACRIYPLRPYVCRTQGLPLRWLEPAAEGRPDERRDICPLNDQGEALLSLPADQCWTLGPVEAELEASSAPLRVALRDLFLDRQDRDPPTLAPERPIP